MSTKGLSPREMAIKKMQEADLWWLVFERAVSKWRGLSLCYLAHKSGLRRALERGAPDSYYAALLEDVNLYHDAMLIAWDEVHSAARSATGCEMASDIYYEEDEQMHWEEADGKHGD